jgi:hypothetical protein
MIVVCVLTLDGQAGSAVRKSYGTFRNEQARMRTAKRLVQRLERLGLDVVLAPSQPLTQRFNEG